MYESQTPILIVGEGDHLRQLVQLAELASDQVALKEIEREDSRLGQLWQLAKLAGRGHPRRMARAVRQMRRIPSMAHTMILGSDIE